MDWVNDANVALLTDLYELTMAASYHRHGMNETATFDLFVRSLPERRSFLVACGLEDALSYLETFRFDEAATAYLRSLELFGDDFLEYLLGMRFTGEVWAMAEGETAFAGEPLLRVTAPRIEAQLVETFLLNCVSFQTLIASKAARVTLACQGRPYADFSARRDHGADAALRAARAAYVGGAASTSNVLAGAVYGIPVSGTMAHSYVQSFAREEDAFRTYAEDFPGRTTLLIDTYDTVRGARRAVAAASRLSTSGGAIQAVRLDSGDLVGLALKVRAVLDEAGLQIVSIFASGDLDEYRISDILAAGAPVDAFGVGTQLGTSADAPALSAVYKLVQDERGPRIKLSTGKVTLPGVKQVYRASDGACDTHDTVALVGEEGIEGRPLLTQVMSGGRRTRPAPPLDDLRTRRETAVARLPGRLQLLHAQVLPYEVRWSPGLQALLAEARGREG
ncbi:MAG: nicotinate phosphoribosyltransferase [Dehalococcoidia bacterium]|nr:nicotinate phosphoribosyltransferase [Dehalococcoidia bacterium]